MVIYTFIFICDSQRFMFMCVSVRLLINVIYCRVCVCVCVCVCPSVSEKHAVLHNQYTTLSLFHYPFLSTHPAQLTPFICAHVCVYISLVGVHPKHPEHPGTEPTPGSSFGCLHITPNFVVEIISVFSIYFY